LSFQTILTSDFTLLFGGGCGWASFSLTLLESYPNKYISSMWQLADEAVNLFDATISNMGVTINYAPDG
jgi:hypothetical protein